MRIKFISTALIMLSLTLCTNSQNFIESQSLSSSGQHNINDWHFDWNLGQTITETFSNSVISAQSGFYIAQNSNISVPELSNNFQFHVFPNPFTDYLHIENFDFKENLEIIIFDFNGKIVINKSIENNTLLDLHFLNSGIYLLTIYQGKIKYSLKVLKN